MITISHYVGVRIGLESIIAPKPKGRLKELTPFVNLEGLKMMPTKERHEFKLFQYILVFFFFFFPLPVAIK